MPVNRINEILIAKLRPHPANVHKHSRKQIAQIADSIKKFDFTPPIIADENATHCRYVAGIQPHACDEHRRHQPLLAAIRA